MRHESKADRLLTDEGETGRTIQLCSVEKESKNVHTNKETTRCFKNIQRTFLRYFRSINGLQNGDGEIRQNINKTETRSGDITRKEGFFIIFTAKSQPAQNIDYNVDNPYFKISRKW